MKTLLQRKILQILQILQILLLLLGATDGFQMVTTDFCVFNSTDPETMQFIRSSVYNRQEYLRFDTNVGWFVGYNEYGLKVAEIWNNDTAYINFMRFQKYRSCAHNAEVYYHCMYSKSEKPYAVLNAAPPAGSKKVLVCSVYGFYPKKIKVTWTNHNLSILSGVTSTDLLQHGDWTYQIHSHLEYTPRSGDQISCMIQHKSLKEPMVLDYVAEGALSDGERNKVAIGASGGVLGLVLFLAGLIFYRHKSRGDGGLSCFPIGSEQVFQGLSSDSDQSSVNQIRTSGRQPEDDDDYESLR